MKRIINIRCLLRNGKNIHQYYRVSIYEKDKLIFKGITDGFGCICVKLCGCICYTIFVEAIDNNDIKDFSTNIFVGIHCLQSYYLFLEENKKNSINVMVTDKFYSGLPIMKGNLNLWQVNI